MRPSILRPTLRLLRIQSPSVRFNSNSTVNPTEVLHFKELASSWWDPHGSSRLLHLMNPLRHDFIRYCMSNTSTSSPQSGLKYLDVGCGGGIFAESAARLAHTESVTAIDPTPEVLDIAREHARQDPLLHNSKRLQYLNKSIEHLPVPISADEQYDVLALWEVIEHIRYPAAFLERCLPFVKPGGWLFLSTIARTWTSWLTTKVVAEDLTRLVPRGTHDWNQYINEDELRSFFGKKDGWGDPGSLRTMGCVYVPGFGWKAVRGSEQYGNYFFGAQKSPERKQG